MQEVWERHPRCVGFSLVQCLAVFNLWEERGTAATFFQLSLVIPKVEFKIQEDGISQVISEGDVRYQIISEGNIRYKLSPGNIERITHAIALIQNGKRQEICVGDY